MEFEDLLNEYNEQRMALKAMVEDLDNLRTKVDALFPAEMDFRNRHLFEEKIKAATELFKAILDIRKEITRTVKDEIEMRRKVDPEAGGESELEDSIDIRRLAKKLQKFQDKAKKLKDATNE